MPKYFVVPATVVLACMFLCCATLACADEPLFPFVIPWSDATKGVATDVSFLNESSAGVNGYIVAKDGHFVESKTGERIRFLGTNFTFESDFPTHSDAELIAAHLAKLGINIVRIHHEDSNFGMLWDKTAPGHTKIDQSAMDRLDYLIYQLKKNGIYVDLNLHVSRQFVPEDGFPASVNNIPSSYDKGIDNIDPQMIALQKQFAADYLTHVNPYTGLSYASDPEVAIIEINNENSAVTTFGNADEAAEKLPDPFRSELAAAWNSWLKNKYSSGDALISSWYPSFNPGIPSELLSSAHTWFLQDQTGKATSESTSTGSAVSPFDIMVTVPSASDPPWHTQEILSGLNLVDQQTYTLSFRAKADKPRPMPVAVTWDVTDWRNAGLFVTPTVGTDWKLYDFVFKASGPDPNHCRISFVLGGDTGSISLADVKLSTLSSDTMDQMKAAFDSQTLDFPDPGSSAEVADWLAFLPTIDEAYADNMRTYLRQTIGVHANIVDSQAEFGDLSSVYREAGSDIFDNHAYWQHPTFPGKPWDPVNWNIDNTPMTDSLSGGWGGTLLALAAYRLADKPYTISEYNHPAPSDYRAEMFPEIATYAASQDWDALFEFDYGTYGAAASNGTEDSPNSKIQGFFPLAPDPAKEAFLPSAALIFRLGELAPLASFETLHLSAYAPFLGEKAQDEWSMANGGTFPDYLGERLQMILDPRVPKSAILKVNGVGAKPASTITVTKTTSGSEYLATGDKAVAAAGFVGGQTVTLGSAVFQFPSFGDNFAGLTLASLDNISISHSKRLLLTLVGKAENQNMGWNANRTSVGDTWGQGPVSTEGIPATVEVTINGPRQVWALDPTGAHQQLVPSVYDKGVLTFTTGPVYQTVWYEITQ